MGRALPKVFRAPSEKGLKRCAGVSPTMTLPSRLAVGHTSQSHPLHGTAQIARGSDSEEWVGVSPGSRQWCSSGSAVVRASVRDDARRFSGCEGRPCFGARRCLSNSRAAPRRRTRRNHMRNVRTLGAPPGAARAQTRDRCTRTRNA